MSWSLITKCFKCSRYGKCVDETLINSAIGDVHYLGTDRGHLGAGTIDMDCQAFDQKADKEKKE